MGILSQKSKGNITFSEGQLFREDIQGKNMSSRGSPDLLWCFSSWDNEVTDSWMSHYSPSSCFSKPAQPAPVLAHLQGVASSKATSSSPFNKVQITTPGAQGRGLVGRMTRWTTWLCPDLPGHLVTLSALQGYLNPPFFLWRKPFPCRLSWWRL